MSQMVAFKGNRATRLAARRKMASLRMFWQRRRLRQIGIFIDA